MSTSITTCGANYYTDGEHISYETKTNIEGTVKHCYFIRIQPFIIHPLIFRYLIMIFLYAYWHGHVETNNANNDPALMYAAVLSKQIRLLKYLANKLDEVFSTYRFFYRIFFL